MDAQREDPAGLLLDLGSHVMIVEEDDKNKHDGYTTARTRISVSCSCNSRRI